MSLPLLTTGERWTGPLMSTADGWLESGAALEALGDAPPAPAPDAGPEALELAEASARASAWVKAWANYRATGDAPGALLAGACTVRVRPLSHVELAQAEAEAGPPVALAAFIEGRLTSKPGTEARAREVLALPAEDQQALHLASLRHDRLTRAIVSRACEGVEGIPPGPIFDTLDRVAPALREWITSELMGHWQRVSTLSAEGKAHAGRR